MSYPKILIVEDNPSDIYLLRQALLGLGEAVDLEIVTDGARAIQFVHQQRLLGQHTHPCVIILDLHIPKHDGLEVLRCIRQEPSLGNTRVVVLTTIASPLEEAELRQMGADYRIKPISLPGYSRLAEDILALCKGMMMAI